MIWNLQKSQLFKVISESHSEFNILFFPPLLQWLLSWLWARDQWAFEWARSVVCSKRARAHSSTYALFACDFLLTIFCVKASESFRFLPLFSGTFNRKYSLFFRWTCTCLRLTSFQHVWRISQNHFNYFYLMISAYLLLNKTSTPVRMTQIMSCN